MTPQRWQQVERLYHAALEQAPAERAVFLDEACADDPDLRAEVDSLLAAAAGGDAFLEASALEVTARALAAELPRLAAGQRLGAYRSWRRSAPEGSARSTRRVTRGSSGPSP